MAGSFANLGAFKRRFMPMGDDASSVGAATVVAEPAPAAAPIPADGGSCIGTSSFCDPSSVCLPPGYAGFFSSGRCIPHPPPGVAPGFVGYGSPPPGYALPPGFGPSPYAVAASPMAMPSFVSVSPSSFAPPAPPPTPIFIQAPAAPAQDNTGLYIAAAVIVAAIIFSSRR